MLPRLTTLVLLVALVAPGLARAQKLDTEEQKTIYALGLAVARNLQAFNLTPEEVATLEAGLTAGLTGQKPAVDLATYEAKLDPLAKSRAAARAKSEREASAAFLKTAAAESGAKTTASGLVYHELKAGSGEHPTAKDKVKVQYTGKLRDGQVFDSSLQRGAPADFPLGRMIPCWIEGISLMKPGGKAEITCPADLAYGDAGVPPGSGDRIPGGAALRFEVELLSVEKGAALEPKPAEKTPAK
jgi:FKBP-type peptidyl-prolyl cis-trans isomerase FkpA